MELGAILEPGKLPKTDKAAILVDAVRMVTRLHSESQKLKDSNSNLQDKIKELKVSIFVFLYFYLKWPSGQMSIFMEAVVTPYEYP